MTKKGDLRSVKKFAAEELGRNPELRMEHLKSAMNELIYGTPAVGRLMLRDLINATCGFPKIGEDIGFNPKSLMRMLSTTTTPNSDNLLKIIQYLVNQEGLTIDLKKVA